MNTISNTDDVIDSRDVIARIEELEEYQDRDEQEELAALKALASQCEGYGDWQYGETLIRGTYFTEYAQQLADDIGAIDRDAKWPQSCIDWEQAADELKADYMAVDFDGVEYWLRA